MDDKDRKELYPEAMRDIGIPAEMSPIQDITGTNDDAAFVEITRPVTVGEPWELRRPLSSGEIGEERKDLL